MIGRQREGEEGGRLGGGNELGGTAFEVVRDDRWEWYAVVDDAIVKFHVV